MKSLPPRRTITGKWDAYCHVCWRPVYAMWIDDDDDPAGLCPNGVTVVTDCAEAMAAARFSAQLQGVLADGE